MSTGEGENPRDGQARRDGDERRADRIGVGGGDDSVSRIQLAARWAEAYSAEGESLGKVLRRFRTAYEYLDAVIHGVEPPEPDSVAESSHISAAAVSSGYTPPPPSWSEPRAPEPAPPPPPPPPPGPPPPWGEPRGPEMPPPPWAPPAPPEPGAPSPEPRPWG